MRWLIILWLVFVTALSLAPFTVKNELGTKGHLHNFGHFSIFLVTAILLCWTANSVGAKLIRYLGVCCFAISMEILEAVIYGSRFEWRDVTIDALGAVIGLGIVSVIPLISSGLQRSEVSPER